MASHLYHKTMPYGYKALVAEIYLVGWIALRTQMAVEETDKRRRTRSKPVFIRVRSMA